MQENVMLVRECFQVKMFYRVLDESMSVRHAQVMKLRARVAAQYKQLDREYKKFSRFLHAPDNEKWLLPLPDGLTLKMLVREAFQCTAELEQERDRLFGQLATARSAMDRARSDNVQLFIQCSEVYYNLSARVHDTLLAILCAHMAVLYREGYDAEYYKQRMNNSEGLLQHNTCCCARQ
jgi:hypothetical protein